jgi:hypothetical protein
MNKIINNLQNRPEHVKTRLVIVFAALATVIVVVLWIFINRLVRVPADDVIETESPFKTFTQIFSKSLGKVKDDYKTQKDSLSNTTATDTTGSDTLPVESDETNPAAITTTPETTTTP